jgi:hypothetical protein
MSEEPAKYNQDEIGRRIDQFTAETRRYYADHPEKMSRGMSAVRKVLASCLDVKEADLTRKHIAQFLRQMPNSILLRYRGLNTKTLAQAREEIKGEPE